MSWTLFYVTVALLMLLYLNDFSFNVEDVIKSILNEFVREPLLKN